MKDRKLYSIAETRELLGGISRTTIYLLIQSGRLTSVEIGRRRLISAVAISDFIDASASVAGPLGKPPRPRDVPRQVAGPPRDSVGLCELPERSKR